MIGKNFNMKVIHCGLLVIILSLLTFENLRKFADARGVNNTALFLFVIIWYIQWHRP
jgi:hypothetical protein